MQSNESENASLRSHENGDYDADENGDHDNDDTLLLSVFSLFMFFVSMISDVHGHDAETGCNRNGRDIYHYFLVTTMIALMPVSNATMWIIDQFIDPICVSLIILMFGYDTVVWILTKILTTTRHRYNDVIWAVRTTLEVGRYALLATTRTTWEVGRSTISIILMPLMWTSKMTRTTGLYGGIGEIIVSIAAFPTIILMSITIMAMIATAKHPI